MRDRNNRRKNAKEGGRLTEGWVPQRISDYSHYADAVRREIRVEGSAPTKQRQVKQKVYPDTVVQCNAIIVMKQKAERGQRRERESLVRFCENLRLSSQDCPGCLEVALACRGNREASQERRGKPVKMQSCGGAQLGNINNI